MLPERLTVTRVDELAQRSAVATKHDQAGARIAAIIREAQFGVVDVMRRTVAETLLYCESHSAGISLVVDSRRITLSTLACVGPWARRSAVPAHSDQGPQGVVFDARTTYVFRRPGEHFANLRSIRPPAIELLATPFHGDGHARGVLWIVLHDESRQFDREDARRLRLMEQCASAAYELAARDFVRPSTSLPASCHHHVLSKREREVLILVARGLTNKAIGDVLGIGHKSVDTYRRRIGDKLGLLSRADCVAFVAASHLQ